MGIPILIVNNDRSTRTKMRQFLEFAGYTTLEAEDVESGLEVLRASDNGMVILFNVVLFNNMMAGTDGIAFLGAAAWHARYGHAHAFVVITPTPDEVEATLGRLLAHLSVPILAEPFTADDLVDVVSGATRRVLVSA